MKPEIKKLEGSEVEITGEISAVDFESFREDVMKEFRKDAEFPGFRKGHAPDNLIIEKLGEEKILYEMAEHALSHYYPEIVKENKIDAIGRPEIAITKIAKDNPLGFKVKTAVMPEIKLADYQKIAKAESAKPTEKTEVTDKDVDDVIDEIRKNRAPHHHAPGEAHSDDEKIKLPELNDEFAKSLGQFESVADLKTKIKENVKNDKERQAKEKKRLKIMEEIISKSELTLPKTLIDSELYKMTQEMRGQLESMGLKYEDYLAHLKKTEDDLKKEWEPEAIKRAKFGLLLEEIAKKEKITATAEELDTEVNHILEHYKDADPERVRSYAENMITNEAVFKFLENLR